MGIGRFAALGSAAAVVAMGGALSLSGSAAAVTPQVLGDGDDTDSDVARPGTVVSVDGADCTANFLFTNGSETFIGMAAHCAGAGSATDVDGCETDSMPLGTPVEVDGAAADGELAYSSWLAMQERGEDDPDACQANDFALVSLDDPGAVDPSMPVFGGPTGLNTGGVDSGEQVFSIGNSPLRAGIEPLRPKEGTSTGSFNGGWTHEVVTVTPGIPGDSGSGFLDSDGQAFGVLSTLQFAPTPGSNGVTDLAMALDYANAHGDVGGVELVTSDEPFDTGSLPVGGL